MNFAHSVRLHIRVASLLLVAAALVVSNAFIHRAIHSDHKNGIAVKSSSCSSLAVVSCSRKNYGVYENRRDDEDFSLGCVIKQFSKFAFMSAVTTALIFSPSAPAFAENELSDIYGGKGFDSSLVDQTCLVNKCSLQAKACLADDPSCRKGLTCTAKCLGDNSCITGCFARFGNKNLDNLLKCTIEDHECIKIAILPGGEDKFGEEPRAPKATVTNFDYKSLEGSWYKVVGFNPNYDCYACQRNTFELPNEDKRNNRDATLVSSTSSRKGQQYMNMEVEFAMPHLLPDGSPPPPRQVRETLAVFGRDDLRNKADERGGNTGLRSIGLNEYNTNEVMIFDDTTANNDNINSGGKEKNKLVLNHGRANEASYSRTAHSEGEMFGLKFWENWYVIGENDPGAPEFKFIYYNGKTRQNTYDGAFIYSRAKSLEPESMAKVYAIAKEAGMNPDQFCRIRNGCFDPQQQQGDSPLFPSEKLAAPTSEPLRGIIASTKVSEFLGVEAVSARDSNVKGMETSQQLQPKRGQATTSDGGSRPWWYEVGDYLENPHRHFEVMDSLRKPMEWPENVR